MIDVTSDGSRQWMATRDGEPAGTLRALVRPDHRCCLYAQVPPANLDVLIALHEAALPALDGDVFAEIDEPLGGADGAGAALVALGYQVTRREHHYAIRTDAIDADRAPLPAGFTVVSAADADLDRVRELDDALRQDVPGSDGWRNDPTTFATELLADPQFDPATYLIAVDASGGYAGLVRIWIRPAGARLGLVAVRPAYRRQGLAMALLARGFAPLTDRSLDHVVCEVDVTNTASNSVMARLGARRSDGGLELVYRR
jgi:RimJ/RimL family protein N-acetyltransferase